MHFENIWNSAESLSKSCLTLKRKDILQDCRKYLEDLSDSDTVEDYQTSLGNLLFSLCSLCAFLEENKKMVINSATALENAIDRKRKEFNT